MADIDIKIISVNTNEEYMLNNIDPTMSIILLKINLELMSGIPTNLQRVSYLDQGDLADSSTLKHNDVVNGACLKMKVWDEWTDLVVASSRGYIDDVFKLGVTESSDFNNANTRQMSPERRKEWLNLRAFVALLLAAHHGHRRLVHALINAGANFIGQTKHGRNILHIAAASGQSRCIEMLLNCDVANLIDEKDCDELTPIECTISYSDSSKILYMFKWNLRTSKATKNIKKLTRDDLMAHQLHDSSAKTSMKGKYKQHYQSKILPLQEYRGTYLPSKKSDLYVERRKKSQK